jgi:hypothetical protein
MGKAVMAAEKRRGAAHLELRRQRALRVVALGARSVERLRVDESVGVESVCGASVGAQGG